MKKTFVTYFFISFSVPIFISFLVVFNFLFTACSSQNPNNMTQNKDPLIVNTSLFKSEIVGGTVVSSQFHTARYVVGVFAPRFGNCTGVLIDKNIVLTAAHCVSANPKSMYVAFGLQLKNPSPQSVRQVIAAVVLPNWRPQYQVLKNAQDLAVIKFRGQAPANYQPAFLLTTKYYLVPRALTLLAGYGATDNLPGSSAGILRETFTVISNPYFSNTEVLLDQSIGRGTCSGDSGGPAFILLNGVYYLWGIASRGDDTCTKTGIYTSVVGYLKWIQQTVASLQFVNY